MKEAYYFPHDTNATQDPKMFMLLTSCGISGIGMYWIIVEMLHQQKDGKIPEDMYDSLLKFYCTTQNQGTIVYEKIKQVLNTTGLVLNKDGFVYADRVLRNKELRSEVSARRSVAGKRSAELRGFNKSSASVEQQSTGVQLGKESKGKEKKGEGNSRPPIIQEVRGMAAEEGISADPDKFFHYQESKGWVGVLDWKSSFRYWASKEFVKVQVTATQPAHMKAWEDLDGPKVEKKNAWHDKHTKGNKCHFCGASVKAPAVCTCQGYETAFLGFCSMEGL